jgi:hypothetical protein
MPGICPLSVSVAGRMPSSGEVVSGRISNVEVTGPSEDVRLPLPLPEAVVTWACRWVPWTRRTRTSARLLTAEVDSSHRRLLSGRQVDGQTGAARLVLEIGRPVAQIAKDLGIDEGTYFALKGGRILDLYWRTWEGRPLGEDEYVLSADEKPGV